VHSREEAVEIVYSRGRQGVQQVLAKILVTFVV
jgi:hypothetical protein